MRTRKIFFFLLISIFTAVFFPCVSEANNLSVSNVRVGSRNPAAKTFSVLFDISWENSWRNKINHDAAWLTIRLQDAQTSSASKKLGLITTSGLNPAGSSIGSNSSAEIYGPSDRTGFFLRRTSSAQVGVFNAQSVMVTVDYSSAGFLESSEISVSVIGMEMVYVPQGSFYAGDHATSAASLKQGAADTDPWFIQNENGINVTAAANDGFYYTSAGNPEEFATGSSFVIPGAYPKGYKGFYSMKYEVTEGQWVDFVNSLDVNARENRDLTDAAHKNADSVFKRNTISCSGSPVVCVTSRPARALTYLNWMDLCAFLDWAALRPMTELEFEKTARGPYLPLRGEYAWASKIAIAAAVLSGAEDGANEIVTTVNANAHFSGVTISSGDAANGPEYQQGPLRAGIFATGSSDRISSGAGYYGSMDLSGNVSEFVVSVGSSAGIGFSGMHGDGYLATASGFEGNANVAGWPGMDVDASKGVVIASGSGLRGGSWMDPDGRLRVSDRQSAVYGIIDATAYDGGRGARSYDGE